MADSRHFENQKRAKTRRGLSDLHQIFVCGHRNRPKRYWIFDKKMQKF